METLARIATGQATAPWQMKVGGFVMAGWCLMDVVKFMDWVMGKLTPSLAGVFSGVR